MPWEPPLFRRFAFRPPGRLNKKKKPALGRLFLGKRQKDTETAGKWGPGPGFGGFGPKWGSGTRKWGGVQGIFDLFEHGGVFSWDLEGFSQITDQHPHMLPVSRCPLPVGRFF